MKVNVRKEYGFTMIDLALAMIVVVIFASAVASVMYSLYISTTEAKRTAVAVNYAVDIFEEVAAMSYDSVNGQSVLLETANAEDIREETDGTTVAKIRNI